MISPQFTARNHKHGQIRLTGRNGSDKIPQLGYLAIPKCPNPLYSLGRLVLFFLGTNTNHATIQPSRSQDTSRFFSPWISMEGNNYQIVSVSLWSIFV